MDYWIKLGMPPEKIALGMATYGRSFRLADPNNHGLNAPCSGLPQAGVYTREQGFLAYYEICTKQLTIVEENAAGAPYGYSGNLWVGFDTPRSLEYSKSGLVIERGTLMTMELVHILQ